MLNDANLQLINFAALLAILTASIVMMLSGLVYQLGYYIPANDIDSDYYYGMIFAFLLLAFVYIVPWAPYARSAINLVATMKTLVVLIISLFYESNYSFLDSYSYYFVGLNEQSFDIDVLAGGSGTELIYLIVHYIYKVIPPSYHAAKAIFSFIGLLGILIFSFGICKGFGIRSPVPFLFVGLWPSILFWTSILGKDPIVFLGIALIFYSTMIIYNSLVNSRPFELSAVLAACLGVVLCGAIRPWIIYVFVGAGFVSLFIKGSFNLRLLVFGLGVPLAIVAVPIILNYFGAIGIAGALEVIDANSRGWADDGTSGQFHQFNLASYEDYIIFLPIAVPVALFGPLPFQVQNLFGFFAGLENAVLLWMSGVAVFAYWKSVRRDGSSAILIWILISIVGWGILYGPISFQNLGTAVRFKVQILPYMLAFIIGVNVLIRKSKT